MLDPRPDLIDDTMTWDFVLLGCSADAKLHDILAGLRCEGATLYRTPAGTLRLEWKAAARRTVQGEAGILKRFLEPVKEKMVELFARVEVWK